MYTNYKACGCDTPKGETRRVLTAPKVKSLESIFFKYRVHIISEVEHQK